MYYTHSCGWVKSERRWTEIGRGYESSAERLVGLLWGTDRKATRGPKPSLRVEEIVREGVRIADGGGLGALSMARVAEGLGVTTMALYRYVPGKSELVELMLDAAVGEALVLPRGGVAYGTIHRGYREKLAVSARQLFAVCNLHPWILEVPIGGPPLGPGNLAWLESVLEALSETGIDGREAVGVALLLSGYVRGAAQVSVGLSQAERRTGMPPDQWGPVYARLLERVVADGRFPRLADVVASGAFNEPDGELDGDFEFGLRRVLDGVEAFVEGRSVQAHGG